MTVDCMSCLVLMERGMPNDGGEFKDSDGVTHATVCTNLSTRATACTIGLDDDKVSWAPR